MPHALIAGGGRAQPSLSTPSTSCRFLCPHGPPKRLPHGGKVPRHPLVRPLRRAAPWPGRLLAGILSALLLAAVHCSPFLASDDHGHAVATASASELTHQHPVDVPADGHPEHGHSSECVSPGLAPQPQGGSQSTAGAATVLSLAIASAPAMAEPPAAPPGADRTPIAQSGRSTLTSICRWRI